jgi:hypothetical protein
MSSDGTDRVEFKCQRDGWTLEVTVRTVSAAEADIWMERTAGETVVDIRAHAPAGVTGEDAQAEADRLVVELRSEIAEQLASIDGVDELGGQTEPGLAHGFEITSHLDIALMLAAKGAVGAVGAKAATAVIEKVRGVLAARRESAAEDWRNDQGYL